MTRVGSQRHKKNVASCCIYIGIMRITLCFVLMFGSSTAMTCYVSVTFKFYVEYFLIFNLLIIETYN
jgi:hypothetical protein